MPGGIDGTPAWAYTEDGYCVCCGNGYWKYHMPECELSDLIDFKRTALVEQVKALGPLDGRHVLVIDPSVVPDGFDQGQELEVLLEHFKALASLNPGSSSADWCPLIVMAPLGDLAVLDEELMKQHGWIRLPAND